MRPSASGRCRSTDIEPDVSMHSTTPRRARAASRQCGLRERDAGEHDRQRPNAARRSPSTAALCRRRARETRDPNRRAPRRASGARSATVNAMKSAATTIAERDDRAAARRSSQPERALERGGAVGFIERADAPARAREARLDRRGALDARRAIACARRAGRRTDALRAARSPHRACARSRAAANRSIHGSCASSTVASNRRADAQQHVVERRRSRHVEAVGDEQERTALRQHAHRRVRASGADRTVRRRAPRPTARRSLTSAIVDDARARDRSFPPRRTTRARLRRRRRSAARLRPSVIDGDSSTSAPSTSTVSSRYTRVCNAPMRAVADQSMRRGSSPSA